MTQFKYWFLRFDIKKSRSGIWEQMSGKESKISWNHLVRFLLSITNIFVKRTTCPKLEIPKSTSWLTKLMKLLTPLTLWLWWWIPFFGRWLCHQFCRWFCRAGHWNQRWFLKQFWPSFGIWFGIKSFSNVTKLSSSTIKLTICGVYPVLMGIKSDDLITYIYLKLPFC